MNEKEVALFTLKERYPEYFREGLDLIEWAKDNIILSQGDNYALFEFMSDNTVAGHYFFTDTDYGTSFILAETFIQRLFNEYPEVKVIVGRTPKKHSAALALTKRLGFSHIADTEEDEAVFMLERPQSHSLNGKENN